MWISTQNSVVTMCSPFAQTILYFARSAHMDTMYSGQQYQIGPNRISCFLTTLRLGAPYLTWILHRMTTDGKQEYVSKDQSHLWDYFEKGIRSYDKHHEATTFNTIMTVLWQAISSGSNLDPHFDSGVGTPFAQPVLTCTLCISPEPLKWDTLYSVQVSNSDVWFSNYMATLETVHWFCIGWRPMANRNILQKSNSSYALRNKSGAMTSTTKPRCKGNALFLRTPSPMLTHPPFDVPWPADLLPMLVHLPFGVQQSVDLSPMVKSPPFHCWWPADFFRPRPLLASTSCTWHVVYDLSLISLRPWLCI